MISVTNTIHGMLAFKTLFRNSVTQTNDGRQCRYAVRPPNWASLAPCFTLYRSPWRPCWARTVLTGVFLRRSVSTICFAGPPMSTFATPCYLPRACCRYVFSTASCYSYPASGRGSAMTVWLVGYAICWLDGGVGVSGVIAQHEMKATYIGAYQKVQGCWREIPFWSAKKHSKGKQGIRDGVRAAVLTMYLLTLEMDYYDLDSKILDACLMSSLSW